MIRAAVALALVALTTPASGRERFVRVPFVGCPADGQQGPQPAPTTGKAPRTSPKVAAKLAFYSMGELGILAPRGWHCLGLSGSNGSFLMVTPERHRAQEFFNEAPVAIRGPAVQRSLSYGGTSGRYSVVKAISRYFPERRGFVQQVIEMDRSIRALPIGPLPTGPYKSDVIKERTANYLRFTTPAGNNGEGTNSRLLPGDWPIEGFRKVVGPSEEPDLIGVEVRLPQSQAQLVEAILSEAAK